MKAAFIKRRLVKPIGFMKQAQRHGGYEKGLEINENYSFFSASHHKNLFT